VTPRSNYAKNPARIETILHTVLKLQFDRACFQGGKRAKTSMLIITVCISNADTMIGFESHSFSTEATMYAWLTSFSLYASQISFPIPGLQQLHVAL